MTTVIQGPANTYTEDEAAARVNRSRRTVLKWISAGDLEVSEIRSPNGTFLRYSIDEADLLTTLLSKRR